MKTKHYLLIGALGLLVLAFVFRKKLFPKLTEKLAKKSPNLKNLLNLGKMEVPNPDKIYTIDTTQSLGVAHLQFLKLKEGGLSKDPSDSASANPVPDGSGYHTNKGVTWSTFVSNASELGYSPTPKNFYEMPNSIWTKIWSKRFYKPMQKTESDLINRTLSNWAWGSGTGGANALVNFIGGYEKINEMLSEKGEKYTLGFLVNARDEFYKRLIEKKPKNAKFLKGWQRANYNWYYHFQNYAKS
jgi:hypothetical protein